MALPKYIQILGGSFQLPGPSIALIHRGLRIDRTATVLPQNLTKMLFQVTGRILLLDLIGEVTVALGAVATNLKIQANPTAVGASEDLCADLAVASKTLATLFSITGTPTDPLQSGLSVPGMSIPRVIQAGTIDWVTNANDTGEVKWSCHYIPMDDTAEVTALYV